MKLSLSILAAFLAIGMACQGAFAAVTLSLAENQPEDNPVTIAMYKFADLVRAKTNGAVTVTVYAGGQLGQEPETIEQAQTGVIDLARVNSVVLANVSPSMGAFTLPYIFRDTYHKYKVLDGEIGTQALKDLEKVGLIGFGYMEAGTRNFYTRTSKPIKSLEDLKKLKIRVQPAHISTRMVELLGAVPTPMNYGEVYSALQTGVIDGAENDYVSYLTSSHYEVAKNLIEDKHLSPPALLLMNKSRFEALSPEIQAAIRAAAREAILLERTAMIKANEDAKQQLKEAGVNIIELDNAPFQNAVQPIYDEFPNLAEIVAQIRSIK